MFKSQYISAIFFLLLIRAATAQDQAISGDRELLRSLARRHDMTNTVRNTTTTVLSNKLISLSFEMNSRKFIYGNTLIWLNDPSLRENSDISIARCDINKTIEPLLNPARILTNQEIRTVVLDPGHGGLDTGAVGLRNEHEKKVVLDVAKRTRKKLQAAGIEVKLTREKDQTLELSDRSARAKKWNASLFVSIHINSAKNSSAAGIETYLMPASGFPSTSGSTTTLASGQGNKWDSTNILLAYYIHSCTVVKTGSIDRGIRHARFDVLKEAPCPAVLVECGFASNGPEEDLLLQKEYRDALADGIADGILELVRVSKTR